MSPLSAELHGHTILGYPDEGAGMASWDRKRISYRTYNGQVMTIRTSDDGTHVLIAPGHVDDIRKEDGPDHVHLWGLRNGDFRMHDLRGHAALFPDLRSEFKPPRDLDAKQDALVARARALASGTFDRQAFEAAKALQADWKDSGKASPANTHAFRAAMDEFFAKRKAQSAQKQREWDKRKSEWATNKTAKERVVGQVEALASTADLRGSGPKMKALVEEFRKIGPAEKADNDRFWERLNNARTKLRQRNDEVFEKRKSEYARNKAAKERLVSEMRSLTNQWETRGLKDQARALQDQWKTIGHCDRADENDLWHQFSSAKDTVYEKVRSASSQRAWARVQDLEMKLREAEAKVYAAQDRLSQSYNTRTPSFTNPNFSSILSKQNMRQANARDRLESAQNYRDKVVGWLNEARSRANST